MQMCELLRKVRNADMGEKYSKEAWDGKQAPVAGG